MTDTVTNKSLRSFTILAALCAVTFLFGMIRGASIPFWADELATTHIADSSSWAQMMQRSQTLDLQPPLEDALVRMSFHVFGTHEFAGRLPSVISFTVVVACMFLYLRRRSTVWFAAFGALLLLYNQEISYYATEARPYALLMATLGVALLAYDSILESLGNVWVARYILLAATTAMLMSHVFGLFALGAFLLAEFVRSLRRRTLDIPTWLALLLPLISCVLYAPLLRGQSNLVYPPEMRPTLVGGLLIYHSFLYKPITPVIGLGVLLLILLRYYPERTFAQFLRLRAESWTLLLMLLATPLTIAIIMHLRSPQGSFFFRYTLAVVYPATFFIAMFFAWRAKETEKAGMALASFALVATLFSFNQIPHQAVHLVHRGLLAPPNEVASAGGVNAIAPDLPLVDNSAQRFIEADNRLSAADLKRFVYVTDETEAMRVTHSNAGEGVAAMAPALHLHSRVVPYADFIAAHKQFLVLGEVNHLDDWFLKAVIDQGARVRLLGKYDFAGRDQSLWMVSLSAAPTPPYLVYEISTPPVAP